MSNETSNSVIELDVRGMICPLPVLRARKALASMMPGDHLRVICTDPAAAVDFPAFCQAAGHSLVETTCMDETAAADKELAFLICRGG